MSLAALVGGALLYLVLRRYLRQGAEGPPLLRRLDSVRIFELTLIFLSWRAARSAVTLLGTRRLQPQLQLLVGAALLAALWPQLGRTSCRERGCQYVYIWVVAVPVK